MHAHIDYTRLHFYVGLVFALWDLWYRFVFLYTLSQKDGFRDGVGFSGTWSETFVNAVASGEVPTQDSAKPDIPFDLDKALEWAKQHCHRHRRRPHRRSICRIHSLHHRRNSGTHHRLPHTQQWHTPSTSTHHRLPHHRRNNGTHHR